MDNPIICVVGMGYVGYPEAVAFSKYYKVIGYDIDSKKLSKLQQSNGLVFSDKPECIKQADFIIIAVPTPIHENKQPDLFPVESASATVGRFMKKGVIVILESTVYPGVSEEVMVPILERESNFKCGVDFKIGYSPERINPGDELHNISKVTKIVSGMDDETARKVGELYGKIALNVFKVKNIKTAEAIKVVENIQRDLNIALMNELSFIFKRMDINIKDVVDGASTKWNFYKCNAGMVGGHCIPVDPYYLTYKAKLLGYYPNLIYASRRINNSMPKYVANMAMSELSPNAKILIAGLTYKENVADIRESPAKYLIKELKSHIVFGFDPLLDNIEEQFGVESVTLSELKDIDCIIIAVAHDVFKTLGLRKFREVTSGNPLLVDVRGAFDRDEAVKLGFRYLTL